MSIDPLPGDTVCQPLFEFLEAWVERKFKSKERIRLGELIWPDVSWTYHPVHGVVGEPNELKHFKDCGLTVLPFHDVLESLSLRKKGRFSGSAGGELAEIVGYDQAYTKRNKV